MATKRKKKRQPSHKALLARAVRRALTKYHNLYRLPNWPVYYRAVQSIKRAWDGADCAAGMDIEHHSCEVCLDYREDLKLEEVDLIIAHEFAHWLTNDLDIFLKSMLSKRQYLHAKELLETVVEAIAIAVTKPERSQPKTLIRLTVEEKGGNG